MRRIHPTGHIKSPLYSLNIILASHLISNTSLINYSESSFNLLRFREGPGPSSCPRRFLQPGGVKP